jgi:hypothetical protein
VVARRGCGFGREGERFADQWIDIDRECVELLDEVLPDRVRSLTPDVVVLMSTTWDVIDRRWDDGLSGPPTDPAVAARTSADYLALTQRILDDGAAHVAWIRQPIPDPGWIGYFTPQEEPQRHESVYSMMDDVAAALPGRVSVIDLAGHVDAVGWATDQAVRPDGVHWSPESAVVLADGFLGEQIIRAALGLPS